MVGLRSKRDLVASFDRVAALSGQRRLALPPRSGQKDLPLAGGTSVLRSNDVTHYHAGQLTQRADFYQQLGQLTGAGLGLIRALEQLQAQSAGPFLSQAHCGSAAELAGAARWPMRCSAWSTGCRPRVALLQAASIAGGWRPAFDLLTDYYNARARMARG